MKVAINGVGIAGPTLAYWLRQSGHEVLLVEEAPQLRSGGFVVDFWGIGYDIAEKMGVIPRIRELGYQMEEVRLVDRRGRRTGGFRADVFRRLTQGRFTSVRRSDIAATIYGALAGDVETLFGDSVAKIDDDGRRVVVSFDHAAPREFDQVIGADGLHSRVRRLAFGRDTDVEVSLGYHVAAFEIQGYKARDELVYVGHGEPGRQVARFSMREDRTLFLFIFRDEYLPAGDTSGRLAQKQALARIYADVGWEGPEILAALEQVDEIYFDRVSQIRMSRWTNGRVALVGDAAACVSLMAGEGTGLAMAEAYVLAGELGESNGDPAAAFARYQERLMPFLRSKQDSAVKFASAFAPRTRLGLGFRNLVSRSLQLPFLAEFLIGRDLRDDFRLPDFNFQRLKAREAATPAVPRA
jgi:2-polyprenyl-6-methoxyphenol hydroxylase-like FAD-dependent oxidoreductase